MAELNATATPETTPAPAAPADAALTAGQKTVQSLPPADQQTTEPTLKDRVAELGFEGLADDSEAMERLITAYKQQKNLTAQVQEAIEQVRALPTPPATQQPAQEPTTGNPWWNPPQIDQTLIAKYRTADGWKPETPADVRQQGEQWQAYHDRWANDLIYRPQEALGKIIEAEARRIAREEMGQTAAQQQETHFQQKVFNDNPWLFEKDPITGQPNHASLSSEGKLLNQHFIDAQNDGMNFERAWKYALAIHKATKAEIASQQNTAAKTAQETNAEQKRALLARAANGTPNRTGSLPTPDSGRTTQSNRNLRFGQMVAQRVAREGLATN